MKAYKVVTLCFLLLLIGPATAIRDQVSFLQLGRNLKTASGAKVASSSNLSQAQRLMAEKRLRHSISKLAIALRSQIPNADSLDLQALAADARDRLLREAEAIPYVEVADFIANYATHAPDSVLVAPFTSDDEVQKNSPIMDARQATQIPHADSFDMQALAADAREQLLAEAEEVPYRELGDLMANYARQVPDSVLVAPFMNDDEVQNDSPIEHNSPLMQPAEMAQANSMIAPSSNEDEVQKNSPSASKQPPSAGEARDLLLQEAEKMPYGEVADLIAAYATQASDGELVAPFVNLDVPKKKTMGHTWPSRQALKDKSPKQVPHADQTSKFRSSQTTGSSLHQAMEDMSHEMNDLSKRLGGGLAKDILGSIFKTALKQASLSDHKDESSDLDHTSQHNHAKAGSHSEPWPWFKRLGINDTGNVEAVERNVYGEPLALCGTGSQCPYSASEDQVFGGSDGIFGGHQVCVSSLAKDFSQKTGQLSDWSETHAGQPWCIAIWAYSNYVLNHGDADLPVQCDAVSERVLKYQCHDPTCAPGVKYGLSHFMHCGPAASTCSRTQYLSAVTKMCGQCSATAPNDKGRASLHTKCNLMFDRIHHNCLRTCDSPNSQECYEKCASTESDATKPRLHEMFPNTTINTTKGSQHRRWAGSPQTEYGGPDQPMKHNR